MNTLDLSLLDSSKKSEQGEKLQLTHPVTDEELNISITLAGCDSKIFRQAEIEMQTKMLKNRNKSKNIDMRLLRNEIMAKCTLAWSGVVLDGVGCFATMKMPKPFITASPGLLSR